MINIFDFSSAIIYYPEYHIMLGMLPARVTGRIVLPMQTIRFYSSHWWHAGWAFFATFHSFNVE